MCIILSILKNIEKSIKREINPYFQHDEYVTNFYTIYTFLLDGDTPSLTLNNYGTQRSYLTV